MYPARVSRPCTPSTRSWNSMPHPRRSRRGRRSRYGCITATRRSICIQKCMESAMANLKKSSPSNTDLNSRTLAVLRFRHTGVPRRMKLPKNSYRDHFDLVEPQINAEGVHTWSFDAPCPVDVLFLTVDDRHRVRMNRHGYFEVLYL